MRYQFISCAIKFMPIWSVSCSSLRIVVFTISKLPMSSFILSSCFNSFIIEFWQPPCSCNLRYFFMLNLSRQCKIKHKFRKIYPFFIPLRRFQFKFFHALAKSVVALLGTIIVCIGSLMASISMTTKLVRIVKLFKTPSTLVPFGCIAMSNAKLVHITIAKSSPSKMRKLKFNSIFITPAYRSALISGDGCSCELQLPLKTASVLTDTIRYTMLQIYFFRLTTSHHNI